MSELIQALQKKKRESKENASACQWYISIIANLHSQVSVCSHQKAGYLLRICDAHDVQFGRKWERERELFVISALLPRLQRVTERTLSNTKRSIGN